MGGWDGPEGGQWRGKGQWGGVRRREWGAVEQRRLEYSFSCLCGLPLVLYVDKASLIFLEVDSSIGRLGYILIELIVWN